MTVVSTWSEVITTEYRMYYFADFWTPVGEEVTFEDDMGLSRGRLTGFLGMRSPWSAIVLCGTDGGPIRLTVEVHDSPVATDQAHWTKIDAEWSEIIETTFQVRSGRVTFVRWGGELMIEVDLLPLGPWRLRALARGRDEGRAERSYTPVSEDPLEEHLLQFWPADHDNYGDFVMTRDTVGAYYRGGEPRIDAQVQKAHWRLPAPRIDARFKVRGPDPQDRASHAPLWSRCRSCLWRAARHETLQTDRYPRDNAAPEVPPIHELLKGCPMQRRFRSTVVAILREVDPLLLRITWATAVFVVFGAVALAMGRSAARDLRDGVEHRDGVSLTSGSQALVPTLLAVAVALVCPTLILTRA